MKVSTLRAMLKNRLHREQIYSAPDYWDAKAVEYRNDAVSMWPNNNLNAWYHREQTAFIERALPALNGVRALEIGCGTGRITRYLAGRGASITGIDFSAKAIEIARRQSAGTNPQYRVQSVFNLEDNRQFDLVVSWGSLAVACKSRLELLDAMTRIRSALTAPGRVLLLEPIHKGFLHRVLNLSVQEFTDVMEEAGFEVEGVTQLHFWPMRLLLAYVTWPKPITAAGYHLGQWLMRAMPAGSWGDYTAVTASVRT
jgi:SAM-dependent methyltransferase